MTRHVALAVLGLTCALQSSDAAEILRESVSVRKGGLCLPPAPHTFTLGVQFGTLTGGGGGAFSTFRLEDTAVKGCCTTPGESAYWYVADDGDAFSTTTIDAEAFDRFGGDLGRLGEFYLAVTGYKNGVESNNDDQFGWARVQISQDQILLIDSALAVGVDGIVVGTTETVPEPTSSTLAFVTGLGVFVRHRRRDLLHTR